MKAALNNPFIKTIDNLINKMFKMKTRHLLTAMVLPALFAACTSDEFNDNANIGLQGRALLDPNFSVTIDNGNVDTRFSWNEDKFGWNAFTENDKFSAGLVDNANGDIQNKILTNYIFSSKDGGSNYTTTSQMVEGAYFFYSYPNFENASKRDVVSFDLTSQTKIDLNNPAKTVEENQLFVSPIYKLDAEHANIKLPLYFVSYWSTAGIRIKNTSGESFKIRRITLKGGLNAFAVKGAIGQTKLATALTYEWNEETGEYALPEKKANKDLKTLDIADATQTDDAITVDCQAYVLENGKDVTAYIQVPYAALASATVDITVETTTKTGIVLKTVTADVVQNEAEAADGKKVVFKRGSTMPIFGSENIGGKSTLKAYNIDKIVLAGATPAEGNYADSYEAFEEIFMAAEDGDVEINNLGSLKVDDNVMYLLKNLSKKTATFKNKIEITSEGVNALRGATFAGGATVTKGKITLGEDVELFTDQTLTINEGAEVTIADGTYNNNNSKITNNGKLTLSTTSAAVIKEIENGEKAEVVIATNQTINTGQIEAFNAPKALTINKSVTLTITTPALTIGYGQSVTNNGTITPASNAMFVNHGKVTNNGTINYGTNENTAVNANGSLNIAEIDNYGTIAEIANTTNLAKGSALITMKSAQAEIKVVTAGATNAGDIDNTIDGFITTPNNAVVFAKYTTDQNGELGKVMACNKVIVEGCTWASPKLPAAVKTLEMDDVTLKTADFTAADVTSLTMTNCTAEKNITFAGATSANLKGSTFKGAVTLAEATTPTLDYATFNGNVTFSATGLTALNLRGVTLEGTLVLPTQTATITIKPSEDSKVANTTTTVNTITATGLATLAIEANATLIITQGAQVGVAAQTVITNNGKVENRSANVVGKTDGSSNTSGENWKGIEPTLTNPIL